MTPKVDPEIAEIISAIQCPKDFKCAESGFQQICRAMDIGRETYLACIEESPSTCTFAVFFAGSYFCKCPLRIHIAKHLKK